MICPKCGNEIDENEKICSRCGHALFDDDKELLKKKKSFFSKEKLIPVCSTFAAVMLAITTIIMNIGNFGVALSGKEQPSSIIFKTKEERILAGEERTLKYDLRPDNASLDLVNWKTSDTDVVSVKNGRIRAVSSGVATITASSKNGVNDSTKVFVSAPECAFLDYLQNVSVRANLEGAYAYYYFDYAFDGISTPFFIPDIEVDFSIVNSNGEIVYHGIEDIRKTVDNLPYIRVLRSDLKKGTSYIGKCRFFFVNKNSSYKSEVFESDFHNDKYTIYLPVCNEYRHDYVGYEDIRISPHIIISKLEQFGGETHVYVDCDGENIYEEEYFIECLQEVFLKTDYHIYISSKGNEGQIIAQNEYSDKKVVFPANWTDTKDLEPEKKEEILGYVIGLGANFSDIEVYSGWIDSERKKIQKQKDFIS